LQDLAFEGQLVDPEIPDPMGGEFAWRIVMCVEKPPNLIPFVKHGRHLYRIRESLSTQGHVEIICIIIIESSEVMIAVQIELSVNNGLAHCVAVHCSRVDCEIFSEEVTIKKTSLREESRSRTRSGNRLSSSQ
jgi:hypothetical protein